HAFVVDAKLLARLHIVEHHHLLRSDDRRFALLVGVQPGELHVGEDPGGKLHREEHHIFNLALEIALSMRGDAHRRLTQQVQCHGYIVWAETPHGVLVRASVAAGAAITTASTRPSRSATSAVTCTPGYWRHTCSRRVASVSHTAASSPSARPAAVRTWFLPHAPAPITPSLSRLTGRIHESSRSRSPAAAG